MAGPRRGPSALSWVIKIVLALAVSAGALWWTFRDVDLRALVSELAASSPTVILMYCVAQLVVHLVRVVRWALMVGPLGPASRRAIFSSASVGIPAAMFLPLRLGELVRPVMIARAGIPFGGAMASVVAERLADGLTNVGLFFLLLSLMPASSPLSDDLRLMSRIALIGFGGACVLLLVIAVARRSALAVLARLFEPIAPALGRRLTKLLGTFIDGLAPLGQPSRLFGFVVLTAIYWGINGGMTTVLAKSYGIDVPWIAGPFAVVIVVFAVTIPAGPAFTGTLQAGFRLGLAPFAVTPAQAALVGTAVYLIQICIQALILLAGMLTAEPGQRALAPEQAQAEGH
ncbi:MAG: flippase-like domain-containing protein [Deltaproteobacteria bacterium]|nr:flippase-like domain-containing protein [Deltaproteobacteria bacterium]